MTKYYPILKKGNCELIALENFIKEAPGEKQNFIPIIEAPTKINEKNWEANFNSIGSYFSKKLLDKTFAFQFSTVFQQTDTQVSKNWRSVNNLNVVEYFLSKFKEKHLNYIPCLSYDDADWIFDTISAETPKEVFLRLEPYKFGAGLDSIIVSGVLSKLKEKFSETKVTIIIDFYDNIRDEVRIKSIINSVINNEYDVVFSGTACPEDSSEAPHSEFSIISRREELFIYKQLLTEFPTLKFSDYTVRLKPEPVQSEKRQINMNNTYLKIFYTTDENYMVAKSGLIKNQNTDSSHLTIQDACKLIVGSKEYCGAHFSWGDKQIDLCASGELEINGHQKPISIGVNHHLAVVLNQL